MSRYIYLTAGNSKLITLDEDATINIDASEIVGSITVTESNGKVTYIPLNKAPYKAQLGRWLGVTTILIKADSLSGSIGYEVENTINDLVASYATDASGNVIGLNGSQPFSKKPTSISAFVPFMPTNYDSSTITLTQNAMYTAPGDFDAVAIIEINVGGSPITIDSYSVAVSERSDTSKTIPVINGTSYNALASGSDQNGWIPVTWSGATPVTVAAGSFNRPTLAISDWIPLSSIPRVETGKTLPLVMVRKYINTRTQSNVVMSSAAEQDAVGTNLAPYEMYQCAQLTVDGVSSPSSFTTTWIAGSNTATLRIHGLAFRMRGSAETVLFVGDSIIRGLGAGGDVVTTNALNMVGGFCTKSAISLANKNNPVGFINAGQPGRTSSASVQNAIDWFALLRPTVLAYQYYTPNDAPVNYSLIASEFSRAEQLCELAFNVGTVPLLISPVPYQFGNEAIRLKAVERATSMRKVYTVNPNISGVYDVTNSGGYYWATGAQTDNVHPSNAGTRIIADSALTPVLRAATL